MWLTDTDAARHIPLHREKDFSERVSGHKTGGAGGGRPHIFVLASLELVRFVRFARLPPRPNAQDSPNLAEDRRSVLNIHFARERERERENGDGASVQVQHREAVGNLTEEEAACINGIEPIERKGGGRREGGERSHKAINAIASFPRDLAPPSSHADLRNFLKPSGKLVSEVYTIPSHRRSQMILSLPLC